MTEEISTPPNHVLGANLGWRTAAELLKPFGSVAANFTEAIRLLTTAYSEDTPLSPGGGNHIIRLLKNNTIKATYYFFSRQFRPELLRSKRPILPDDFLQAFAPMDHAAIITLCYLYKNLTSLVDREDWEYVQNPLYEALAVGGQIGKTVPQVGLGIGLLTRGLRYLAFAPLIREDRKAFKEYRQHLKAKDTPFDTAFEQKMWQCTSVQITGLLLEQIGYSRSAAIQYVSAIERTNSPAPDSCFGVPVRLSDCLIDAYMEGHEIPTSTPAWVGQEIALPAEVRGNLLASLKHTAQDHNRIEWLNKSSAHINLKDTPELCVEPDEEAEDAENDELA
jgi:hypothetical protein